MVSNSSPMKKNIQFLRKMREKYKNQVDSVERTSPLPYRSNTDMKARLDGSN